MQKYIYQGGIIKAGQTVSRAIIAHFSKYAVYQAAPTPSHLGSIPIRASLYAVASAVLTPAQNGLHVVAALAASSLTLTLPKASFAKGMTFSMSLHILPVAGVGHRFLPVTGDKFIGCGLVGTASQSLGCAAAGDVLGDRVEIVSDGVDTWHIVQKTGIWAVNV